MLKLFKYTDRVSFPASGTLEQSVSKLESLLNKNQNSKSLLDINSEPFLNGDVSNNKVKLYKVTPMYGNTFKPIFFGKFEENNNKVSLVGVFKIGFFERLMSWVFSVIGIAVQIITLPLIDSAYGIENLKYFWPLLFVLLGILIIFFAKLFSKKDVDWITKQITNTI